MVFGFIRADKTRYSGEFPKVLDPASCKEWLATLVPPDAEENLQRLNAFLAEIRSGIESSDWTAERKFMIVERVRVMVVGLLQDRLHDAEARSTLLEPDVAIELWRLIETAAVLRDTYKALVPSLPARSQEPLHDKAAAAARPCAVDALHRAIDLSAMMLCLNQRVRIVVPAALWDAHCELGKMVRQLDCHDEVVQDAQRLALTDTGRKAFVMPILVALADPFALSLNEFAMMSFATHLWAVRVAFRIDPGGAITLTARPETKPGPCVYLGEYRVRFDTQSLIRNINRSLLALEEGVLPKDWARERNLSVPGLKNLLLLLKRRWGLVEPEEINYPEISWRPPSVGNLLAVAGWQDHDKQRETRALTDHGGVGLSRSTYVYQRQREDRIAQTQEEADQARLQRLLVHAETWNLAGETADALLCARRQYRPSLYLNQLVGVKLGAENAESPYLLAWVQGLQQSTSEDQVGLLRPSSTHLIRLHLFAGRVRTLRVVLGRADPVHAYLLMPLDFHDISDQTERLMEAMQASTQGFTLILPVTSYAEGCSIKMLLTGEEADFRMAELLTRGLDFDQVSFG